MDAELLQKFLNDNILEGKGGTLFFFSTKAIKGIPLYGSDMVLGFFPPRFS